MTDTEFELLQAEEKRLYEHAQSLKTPYDSALNAWSRVYQQVNREVLRREIKAKESAKVTA